MFFFLSSLSFFWSPPRGLVYFLFSPNTKFGLEFRSPALLCLVFFMCLPLFPPFLQCEAGPFVTVDLTSYQRGVSNSGLTDGPPSRPFFPHSGAPVVLGSFPSNFFQLFLITPNSLLPEAFCPCSSPSFFPFFCVFFSNHLSFLFYSSLCFSFFPFDCFF